MNPPFPKYAGNALLVVHEYNLTLSALSYPLIIGLADLISTYHSSLWYIYLQKSNLSLNIRKRTYKHVRTAKIQISLRIRAVWSESSLGAFLDSQWYSFFMRTMGTDRTAQMRRLIWVFVGRIFQKALFLMKRLIIFQLLIILLFPHGTVKCQVLDLSRLY